MRQPSRKWSSATRAAAICAVLTLASSAPIMLGTARAGGPVAEALADRAMLDRLTVGSMAKFRFADVPRQLPDLRLSAIDGSRHSLGNWKGRTVLLNVWASWCAPCRDEMPSLQRLQTGLAGDGLVVVTLSFDKAPADAVRFLADLGLASLPLLVDPEREALAALSVVGAPTSILVDPAGHELGRIAGAADWASPEAMLLVKAMIVKSFAGARKGDPDMGEGAGSR